MPWQSRVRADGVGSRDEGPGGRRVRARPMPGDRQPESLATGHRGRVAPAEIGGNPRSGSTRASCATRRKVRSAGAAMPTAVAQKRVVGGRTTVAPTGVVRAPVRLARDVEPRRLRAVARTGVVTAPVRVGAGVEPRPRRRSVVARMGAVRAPVRVGAGVEPGRPRAVARTGVGRVPVRVVRDVDRRAPMGVMPARGTSYGVRSPPTDSRGSRRGSRMRPQPSAGSGSRRHDDSCVRWPSRRPACRPCVSSTD
jgi:hypothetical protein